MKYAIIGSGIAGLYLGYKLKKLNKDFTIFESESNIGGRVKMFDFQGKEYISGAGILTKDKDVLMINLCKELGIELKEPFNI